MSNDAPYLSIVVTSRNDDHGGSPLRRTQTFVNCLIAQCKRHGIPAELIFAEWNPPADKPRLRQVLNWPDDLGPCQVRFIEIPASVHDLYKNAATLPLYQMIGKNVGIRRARGQFILATNIDILFSDELMRFIAARRLQSGHMYRIDRHDVPTDVPVDAAVDEQIEYCRNNLLRVHATEGTFAFTPEGLRALSHDDIAAQDSGIFFGEGWFAVEHNNGRRFRWVNDHAKVTLIPHSGRLTSLLFELEPGPGVGSETLDLSVVNSEGAIAASIQVRGRSLVTLELPETGTPLSFSLRVMRGGKPVLHDPRALNFRVFRCEWIGRNRDGPDGHGYTLYSRPAIRLSLFTRWVTPVWNAIVRIAETDSDIQAPPRVRLLFRFLFQSGSLRHSAFCAARWAYRRRLLSATVPYGDDISRPASGIDLGIGWHDIENYLGENFRWVGSMSELLIRIPQAPPRTLLLQIEVGPSAINRGLQLRVEDESGSELHTVKLRRIHLVSIPVHWEPGRTRVIRVRVIGGGDPVPGDSRILNFRVFWVGWSASGTSKRPDMSSRSLCLAEPAKFDHGVAWGHGWSELRRDHLGDAYREIAGEYGEVLLRLADRPCSELEADIRPADLAAHGDNTIRILDAAGRRILAVPLLNGMHRFALPVNANETSVFRVQCVDGQEKPVPFRIYRFQWAVAGTGASAAEGRSPAAPPISLHTNACGDFTLMAREHWFDVRAYPEWDLYSFHIDSVLCYAAHHSGALEYVLKEPMRIYHIEHGRGSGWTPEGESQLFERLRAKGVSWIEYQELVTWIAQMRRLDCPLIFNRENWGLADLVLPETPLGGDAK